MWKLIVFFFTTNDLGPALALEEDVGTIDINLGASKQGSKTGNWSEKV